MMSLFRFIPACAGNTRQQVSIWTRIQVHPRMRGEYVCAFWHGLNRVGSSPHARGIPRKVPEHIERQGFIPACAGNTPFLQRKDRGRRVHPRMRGEYGPICIPFPIDIGSSPHARGIPTQLGPYSPTERFIPACAGNTTLRGIDKSGLKVHPRMRGEYLIRY